MATSKAPKETAPMEEVKTQKFVCKVYHMDMDQENRDVPISVCVNSALNRKKFLPGEEVVLTESEIQVLRNAIINTQIVIPGNSGIYEARDPVREAKKHYKDMEIVRDRRSGQILAIKNNPRFLVEIISVVN